MTGHHREAEARYPIQEMKTEGGRGNSGTLIIDASCIPADIAYPTDMELCDRARRWTETILDHYWTECGPIEGNGTRSRTYRKTARKRFLNLNKRRKKHPKDTKRIKVPAKLHWA